MNSEIHTNFAQLNIIYLCIFLLYLLIEFTTRPIKHKYKTLKLQSKPALKQLAIKRKYQPTSIKYTSATNLTMNLCILVCVPVSSYIKVVT